MGYSSKGSDPMDAVIDDESNEEHEDRPDSEEERNQNAID